VNDKIKHLRQRINQIDDELLKLLVLRARTAISIGELKSQETQPVRDETREQQIIERILSLPHQPIPSAALRRLYMRIMTICRTIQQ